MNTSSFTARAGALSWWTMGQETSPEDLTSGLTRLEMPNAEAKPRTWHAALKAAMGEMFDKTEELVRPLKNPKKNGYAVVVEDKGKEDNDYSERKVIAKVSEEGVVEITRGIADQYEMQRLTNYYRSVLPGSAVTSKCVHIINKKYGGLTLKKNGGLYFIPDEWVGSWMRVCEVVAESALRDSCNDMSVNPMELNEMTIRDLRNAITKEVTAAAKELQEDITGGELGEQALLNRATRAQELRQRTRVYEALLNETLEVCHVALDTAVEAFSTATAIQEEEDVFA